MEMKLTSSDIGLAVVGGVVFAMAGVGSGYNPLNKSQEGYHEEKAAPSDLEFESPSGEVPDLCLEYIRSMQDDMRSDCESCYAIPSGCGKYVDGACAALKGSPIYKGSRKEL